MALINLTLWTIFCIIVGVSTRAYHRDSSDNQVNDVVIREENSIIDNEVIDQASSESISGVSDRAYNHMSDDDDDDDDDDEQLQRRSPYNSDERRAFDLTNQARGTGRWCGSKWYPAVKQLLWNDQLADAARRHAQDMRDNNYFSHTSKDGRSPWTRIKNAGYICGSAGENIAGNGNVDNTITSWLNSPGHCANIMGDYKQIGIGVAYGGPYGAYWVQAFGGC